AAGLARVAGGARHRHRCTRTGPGGRDRARTGTVGVAAAAVDAGGHAAAATHRPAGAAAVPAHARAVRVRICQPAFRRLARPGPGRLLAPGVRGDRQATLCHRGLRRVAAVAAAGPDLHPRLDAAAGAPLGPPAPAGVRDRGAGGAALLVDREVRLSRTAAVRGDPRAAARLADGQAAGATADLSPARTAAARPGPRRCRPRPTAARG